MRDNNKTIKERTAVKCERMSLKDAAEILGVGQQRLRMQLQRKKVLSAGLDLPKR